MVVYDLLVSLSKESIDVLRFVEANLAAFNQQYIFSISKEKTRSRHPFSLRRSRKKFRKLLSF